MSRRKKLTGIALHVLLTVLAILWLVPVFWLVLSSFRAEKGAYTFYLWPKSFTFANYRRLFTDTTLFKATPHNPPAASPGKFAP